MSLSHRIWLTALFSIVSLTVLAQDGVSTASAARTKYLGNLGVLPSSREIAVEEFVNYHRHEIGRPKAGESVNLDLRWGNDVVSNGHEAVLQVGLSTALANDSEQLRPLNLALVIDKSGSMADANKLTRVKTALLTLVSQLRESDTLSIVTFDSEASVILPAERLTDKESVKDLIRSIEPGSSTNIDAGLMLGYKEALKHYRKDSTNRVILLTDGIANQGVTEPAEIAKDSLQYNDRGIDLSTIGVGLDLNKDLLRQLAKSGRGLFHFVADSDDIQKVFVNELQSLVSPVATEPNLEIQFDSGLQLSQVYGYEPKLRENSVKIKLDNMNSGLTEVLLVRFKSSSEAGSRIPVKVRLTYYDLDRKRQVTKTEDTILTVKSGGSADLFADNSVAKNYTIALLAQSIKDMASDVESKHNLEAERVLDTAISQAKRRYPSLQDPDILRTLTMAEKYQTLLRAENGTNVRELDRGDDHPQTSNADNLIANGDFSQGNTGFVSDREFIKPSPNCLWGAYYTISARFDSPFQLHTNAPSRPFSAPGGGQVLFMNTGGSDQFTLWSSQVRCKPHAKYRITFQEIGLSGGHEWDNVYEIRVNDARSQAQVGGTGQYKEISFDWESGPDSTATISIVRLPNPHSGGVVGISNIQMVRT